MYDVLLQIRIYHLEGSVCELPAIIIGGLVAQLWQNRPVRTIIWMVVAALEACLVGFVASLEEVSNTSLGIGLAEVCIALLFTLLPVLAGSGGYYRPTLKWWAKYSLCFTSGMLTLFGAPLAMTLLSMGIRVLEVAAVMWCFTYAAFTLENGLVPKWLKRKV